MRATDFAIYTFHTINFNEKTFVPNLNEVGHPLAWPIDWGKVEWDRDRNIGSLS